MGTPSAPLVGRIGRLVLQLFATAVVTWFLLRAVGFDLEEIGSYDLSVLEVRWGVVAASSLALLVAYLYSASLWGLMVREIGGCEVGIVPALRVFFVANLGRYVPGKIWQIAGLAYLARGVGVPAGTATGAAILGQAFSLAGATLVGAGILLRSGRGPGLGGGWTATAILALLVVATFPAMFRALVPLWFRLAREPVPGGFRPDQAFGARWMGLYALGWILQGMAFWGLARGLSMELTVVEGVTAYSAAYVAGYVALFAPAGAGVREGVLVAFLGPFLGGASAAVLALVARLWTTLMELIPALALAGGLSRTEERGEKEGV